MPWFITTVVKYNPHVKRTFGFYDKYQDAYKAIIENRGNMSECLYDYLIVEYIEQGIHPEVHTEEWWWWVEKNKRWENGIEKPENFKSIINWALG